MTMKKVRSRLAGDEGDQTDEDQTEEEESEEESPDYEVSYPFW